MAKSKTTSTKKTPSTPATAPPPPAAATRAERLREAEEMRDRLVALVKLVEPLIKQGLALSEDLFPEGLPHHLDWPPALQNGLDLGDDGLDSFYLGLSAFCVGDYSSRILTVASDARRGHTFLDEDHLDD